MDNRVIIDVSIFYIDAVLTKYILVCQQHYVMHIHQFSMYALRFPPFVGRIYIKE